MPRSTSVGSVLIAISLVISARGTIRVRIIERAIPRPILRASIRIDLKNKRLFPEVVAKLTP